MTDEERFKRIEKALVEIGRTAVNTMGVGIKAFGGLPNLEAIERELEADDV